MRALFLVASVFCAGCGDGTFAESFFEADDDGWLIANNGASTRPDFLRSGGNPGGHLCATDLDSADLWYFAAPSKYSGDASRAYGRRITFDLKQFSFFMLNSYQRDVVLNGGGLGVVRAYGFLPGRDWTPYSVTIAADAGWRIDDQSGEGRAATEEDLRLVLRNLTTMRIRGEFFEGPGDTACLDNVYFGRP